RFSRDWSSDVCSSDLLVGSNNPRLASTAAFDRLSQRHFINGTQGLHVFAQPAQKVRLGNQAVFDDLGETGGQFTGRQTLECCSRSEERRVGKEWRLGV